jgi:TatD DNase family protein
MIDTHAHLYDVHFQEDIPFHIKEIQEAGVTEVWLPNCDFESWADLKKLSTAYPEFVLPMIGLHPTYVKENYLAELAALKAELEQTKVLAIGEIGLDYYWDITFANEQMDALKQL